MNEIGITASCVPGRHVSFPPVHIGHFVPAPFLPLPPLRERVLAWFRPGGRERLHRGSSDTFIPLTDQELDRLERVLKERWELSVQLRPYLRHGALKPPSTHLQRVYRITWPLAAVARDELGLTVLEGWHPLTDEQIRGAAESCRPHNAAVRALHQIEGGEARVRAIAEDIRRGGVCSREASAHELLEDVGSEIVPMLASLLAEDELRWFACAALAAPGRDASAAVAALEQLLQQAELSYWIASYAVEALAKIGPAAEAALSRAVAEPQVREMALLALAALPELASDTRGRVVQLARGDDELAELARHVLGDSVIAKRLTALRARHGDIDVGGDLAAWARAVPEAQVAAVVAAALDARSARTMPRAGALSRAIAAAVRAGNVHRRLRKLESQHGEPMVPGPDSAFQRTAVAGLTDRVALVRTVCGLDNPRDMFLLLRERPSGWA